MTFKTEIWYRTATYTDGSLVREGDRIRYHQALGGLMSPSVDANGSMWKYGTAVRLYQSDDERARAIEHMQDVDELVIEFDPEYRSVWGGRGHLFSHVIERVVE